MESYAAFFFCSFMVSVLIISAATDSLNTSQSLTDGETLVSADESFELGFFKPGNSTGTYLGIWYKKISNKTVVWVANREASIVDLPGVLRITNLGILELLDRNKTIIWSSNSSRIVQNPVAQLLDSGNLVVKAENDNNPENFLWQSFDYPGDTLLPGMKLGTNFATGQDRYLSSWKSKDDPSVGDCTFRIDPRGFPQLLATKGSREIFRSGPWNGLRFSGTAVLIKNEVFTFDFVLNKKEVYFTTDSVSSSIIARLVINENAFVQHFLWRDQNQVWEIYMTNVLYDNCDSYAICDPYSICNSEKYPQCQCMEGFITKTMAHWDVHNLSDGCVRRRPFYCPGGDGFIKYSSIKLPDTRDSWYNLSMSLSECKMVCLKNCSCMAYANQDIRGRGSGCLLWFGDLIDIRHFKQNGQDIYVRMASSEVGRIGSDGKKRVRNIAGSLLSTGVILISFGLALYFWRKKKLRSEGDRELHGELAGESQEEDLELPLFDLATVAKATNNFTINNKLGEGGFGPVYKGTMDNGQEIAVKRLSKNSKQGLDEFKNEVLCIAKLQHRNLVRLLGCCIKEKMLIYEYLPNKSLDFFIFDETRSKLLNWSKRYHIINGIARGILYLHQDSRLRIIHRDLKTSNILLDYEMNAKISDFGLAKTFGGNETEEKTTTVVGTHGYLSPEYAAHGLFSMKSDVFSFGVIVLEIVSGKRNRKFGHAAHNLSLLGHAWELYNEGRALELLDASTNESCNLSEVLRSIQMGLLCVQGEPEDRPSMSSVVVMLDSEIVLPQPKAPGFYIGKNSLEADPLSNKQESGSANEVTLTLLSAR